MKTNLKSTFNCSFCSSKNMELVMDFGKVALAGAFIKNKKLRNKVDTLKIESGKQGLTQYLKKKKIKILVVNSDAKKYEENKWKFSETYNFLKHDKSIISDKHSRKFLKLNNNEKNKARMLVWGHKID